MRRMSKIVALAAATLLALGACAVFEYSANDLKNKSVTYNCIWDQYNGTFYTYTNGHNCTTLDFDDTGLAGSFTTAEYTYNYATTSSYAMGVYTLKTWFQNDGYKGNFTYDPDTFEVAITVDTIYAPKKGATAISGSLYAAADYEYQTMDSYLSNLYGTTYTACTYTYAYTMQLNADNAYIIYKAGDTDGTWTSHMSEAGTRTYNAAVHAWSNDYSETYTITEGSFVVDSKVVADSTSGAVTASTNYEFIWTYAINNAFIVGQEDPEDAAFTDVWKKGNAVTFQVEQTQYTEVGYTTSLPSVPSVNNGTGIGLTGTRYTAPYYYIDNNVQNAGYINLTHKGEYFIKTSSTNTAARDIAAR